MNRVMRYVLVGMLVATLAVDSVAARQLFKRCCRPKCCVACPVPCEPTCETVSFDDSAAQLSSLNCGGSIVSWSAETTGEHLPTESALTAPLPSEPTPTPAAEQTEPEETIPAPNPTDESAASSADVQAVLPPAPIAAPQETAPVEPMPSTPASEQPAPSIVGDRYSSQPADDDIFGTPTPTESIPAPTTPAAAQPADDTTDIFGEPTAAADTPAADETSLPAPSQPTSEQPAAEPTPAEQPPTNEPDSDLDDLFGPADSSTATDEEEEEQPADESSQPSSTPQPSTPEPAAPTPAEPKTAEPATDDSQADDSDTPEADTPKDNEEPYDPFGEGFSLRDEHTSTLLADGGLRSEAHRTWTDNSGSFQCQARLQRVTSGGVVLLRSTGKQLNVPFARLADDDLQFVHQQVTALRVVQARDAAAQKLAVTWSR